MEVERRSPMLEAITSRQSVYSEWKYLIEITIRLLIPFFIEFSHWHVSWKTVASITASGHAITEHTRKITLHSYESSVSSWIRRATRTRTFPYLRPITAFLLPFAHRSFEINSKTLPLQDQTTALQTTETWLRLKKQLQSSSLDGGLRREKEVILTKIVKWIHLPQKFRHVPA